jgi:hypothetical protein
VVGVKEAKGFEKFLWERDRCSDNAMEEKGERRMREKEACRKIQEWSLWRRGGY